MYCTNFFPNFFKIWYTEYTQYSKRFDFMKTVKYSDTDKLKEIQARLFLLTNKQLTQQEILETSVEIISEKIDLLIERLVTGSKSLSDDEKKIIRSKFSSWGPDSKDVSSTIDKSIYG